MNYKKVFFLILFSLITSLYAIDDPIKDVLSLDVNRLQDLRYISNAIERVNRDSIALEQKNKVFKQVAENIGALNIINKYLIIKEYVDNVLKYLNNQFNDLINPLQTSIADINKNNIVRNLSIIKNDKKINSITQIDDELKARFKDQNEWEALQKKWEVEVEREFQRQGILKQKEEREKKIKEFEETKKAITEFDKQLNSIANEIKSIEEQLSKNLRTPFLKSADLDQMQATVQKIDSRLKAGLSAEILRKFSHANKSILEKYKSSEIEKLKKDITLVFQSIARLRKTEEERKQKEIAEQKRRAEEAAAKARKEKEAAEQKRKEEEAKKPSSMNAKIIKKLQELKASLPIVSNPRKISGTTFEIWNKQPQGALSPSKLNFAVAQYPNYPEYDNLKLLNIGKTTEPRNLDTTQYTYLLIQNIPPFVDAKNPIVYTAYVFAPGKTIYLERSEDQKTIKPQTGKFSLTGRKTEKTDLPLKDNIEKEGIDYVKAVIQ